MIQHLTRRTRMPAIVIGAALALAACSTGGASSSPAASASTASSSSAMASATAAATASPINYKVAFVVPGTLGDKGFFDSGEAGVQKAVTDLGITQKTLQASPSDPAQWLQNLQAVSDGSYNLVITGSTQQHDNLQQAAKAHPDQKYVFFDDQVNLPNVLSIEYKQNEGSYVAGVLAGLVTTDTADFPLSKGNKTVGLVGGMDIPVINDFVVGFKAGALSVDPSINVIVSYAGSFSDPNKGYNLTKAMYDQGADIVFAVAGGTGLGVLKASADQNKYSIGVDSDQNGLYPGHVLASMVKRVDNSLFDSIKAAIDGTAKWGQLVYYGLQNQGVGLIIDQKDVPQSVQDQITAATQKVASGAVTVPTALGS